VSIILEQEEENFYRINADDYVRLLHMSGNNPSVTKIKKFKGKPLYIEGNLNVSNRPISTLGNVIYVNGNLDISRTKFKTLPDDMVKGYIHSYATPYEQEQYKKSIREKLNLNQERRENKEFESNDEESIYAQALYKSLIDEGEIDPLSEDEKDELETIKERLKNLETEYEETENDEEIDTIQSMIDELQDRVDELEERNIDIYDVIYPTNRGWYGDDTQVFMILTQSTLRNDVEYAVIKDEDVDGAIEEYAKGLFDDGGYDVVNSWALENCVDEDSVIQMFEEMYDEWVRDSPESYFDESDFELTPEQERRKDDLESYISELEDYISELEEKQSNLEDEIEIDSEDYSPAFDEIQAMIDEAEKKKDDAQSELDEIEPDNEPTEDMIEDKVEELVRYARRDVVGTLKEYGFEIKNYVDENCIIEQIVNDTDFSNLSGHSSRYDTVYYEGNEYYITRIN